MGGIRKYPLMAKFLSAHKNKKGCWLYPGGRDKDGYALYRDADADRRAHRAAYSLSRGPIPSGLYVCHSCDTPACCNPAHLFLGTARDNYHDAMSKDRHSRGERNGHSKLTAQNILHIRADDRTQMEIAADYNIRQTTVSEIKRRNRWGHIT